MKHQYGLINWIDDRNIEVGGYRLVGLREDDSLDHILYLAQCKSNADRFVSIKTASLYRCYADLIAEIKPKHVLEIGLFQGGSLVFFGEVASPETIVGLELSETPITALDQYARDKADRTHVKIYYGVNQSDRDRVRGILDDDFGEQLIDLVIDDASHYLDATKASFEEVFPRIRPGGCYVIEDWSWEFMDFTDSRMPPPSGEPLRPMVLDLVGAAGVPGSGVAEVRADLNLVMVFRSEAPIDSHWTIAKAIEPLGNYAKARQSLSSGAGPVRACNGDSD